MDSDQESSECPLCLEVLEADDLTFFPCTCCYQICRFCWHRIRTDENGLCPACRKPYNENPAQFKPLTEEELQQVKRDRKLKDSIKKPKTTENRKHLANLRVVQRNLVFVNGLPSRLADTDLLRRMDHFGKYGKIIKLVTSPAHNGQLNSICVYITYSRSEEALNAIQSLSNYSIDGRTLKATLGTTKYCSRFLKGATCQKTDCLYLHEQGDPLASFTKEQMQQGLHLDYERKLMEQYTNKITKNHRMITNGHTIDSSQRRKGPFPTPLLPTTSPNTLNGHSDFESGDETQQINSTFTSTTAIHGDTLNVDSDLSSTSSQTSSEHDPSVQVRISPMKTWPDERNQSFIQTNDSSTTDQIPEYKLFGTNLPSIHTILFGNNENTQPRIEQNEKQRAQIQENDELGFDPCNLFMSALASDIEDERRPLSTQISRPPTSNTYGYDSSWMTQQKYSQPYNGPTFPQQTWNGNSQAYLSNSMHSQTRQSIHPNNNHQWTNMSWTDPAIISYGNKLDPLASQWSLPMQSSNLSSGTNLISNIHWSQQQQQQQQQVPPIVPQTHLLANGIYMPFSTTSHLNDGNRS